MSRSVLTNVITVRLTPCVLIYQARFNVLVTMVSLGPDSNALVCCSINLNLSKPSCFSCSVVDGAGLGYNYKFREIRIFYLAFSCQLKVQLNSPNRINCISIQKIYISEFLKLL